MSNPAKRRQAQSSAWRQAAEAFFNWRRTWTTDPSRSTARRWPQTCYGGAGRRPATAAGP
jgi:hypothetical protein